MLVKLSPGPKLLCLYYEDSPDSFNNISSIEKIFRNASLASHLRYLDFIDQMLNYMQSSNINQALKMMNVNKDITKINFIIFLETLKRKHQNYIQEAEFPIKVLDSIENEILSRLKKYFEF